MIEARTILTIILMASATYLSRILGYMLLRNKTLNPRLMTVLDSVPGCVLISVIAPAFVSDRPANLIALTVTILSATRFPILPTVAIGVILTGLLRHLLGS